MPSNTILHRPGSLHLWVESVLLFKYLLGFFQFFVVSARSCSYSLPPVQVQSNEFPLTLLHSGEAWGSTNRTTLWSKISIRLSSIHNIVNAALFWRRVMLNTYFVYGKVQPGQMWVVDPQVVVKRTRIWVNNEIVVNVDQF